MTPLTDCSRAAVTAMATNGLGGAVRSLLGTSAHARSFLTVYLFDECWLALKSIEGQGGPPPAPRIFKSEILLF